MDMIQMVLQSTDENEQIKIRYFYKVITNRFPRIIGIKKGNHILMHMIKHLLNCAIMH